MFISPRAAAAGQYYYHYHLLLLLLLLLLLHDQDFQKNQKLLYRTRYSKPETAVVTATGRGVSIGAGVRPGSGDRRQANLRLLSVPSVL